MACNLYQLNVAFFPIIVLKKWWADFYVPKLQNKSYRACKFLWPSSAKSFKILDSIKKTASLSIWDRDFSNQNDEIIDEDYREVSYFTISLNCPIFQLVETVSNSSLYQSKIYMIHRTIYKVSAER